MSSEWRYQSPVIAPAGIVNGHLPLLLLLLTLLFLRLLRNDDRTDTISPIHSPLEGMQTPTRKSDGGMPSGRVVSACLALLGGRFGMKRSNFVVAGSRALHFLDGGGMQLHYTLLTKSTCTATPYSIYCGLRSLLPMQATPPRRLSISHRCSERRPLSLSLSLYLCPGPRRGLV